MVEGVNFNPFTGKVFTDAEIQKLDTNHDNKISNEEFTAGISWLSGGEKDEDGEVQIGGEAPTITLSANNQKVYDAATKDGIKDSAKDAAELREFMTTVQDSFIEQYMKSNPNLAETDKSALIIAMKNASNEFVNEYLQKNPKGPFNTKEVAAQLMDKMDATATKKSSDIKETQKTLEDYKTDSAGKYDKLAQYTEKASSDYVTGAEFKEMKKEAVDYVMGLLLNGGDDPDFLGAFATDYKNNSYFKAALLAVEKIKNETDPAKIQEYIKNAIYGIEQFIGTQNADGSSKLGKAIKGKADKAAAAAEAAKMDEYREKLSDINDRMNEAYTRSGAGKAATKSGTGITPEIYEQRMNNIMEAFLKQYKGDGKDLEDAYREFVSKVIGESDTVTRSIGGNQISFDQKFSYLKYAVNNAGSYVSDKEKEDIYNKVADLIVNEMGKADGNMTFLTELYPGIETDKNYIEAQKLMEGIKTSASPKEDYEKIKELLNKMVKSLSVDQIKTAVKTEESLTIKLSTSDGSLVNNIPGYNGNTSIGNDKINDFEFKIVDGKVQFTGPDRDEDVRIFEQLKNNIKTKLKTQLGDKYDEAKMNQWLDQAILQGLSFKQPGDGACYSIRMVVDRVINSFNEIATKALHGEKTNASVTPNYGDKSLTDGLSTDKVNYKDWSRKSDGSISLNNNDQYKYEQTMTELYNRMVTKYKAALGDKFDEEAFKKIFNQAQANTLSLMCGNQTLADGGTAKGDKFKRSLSMMTENVCSQVDRMMLEQK